MPKDYSPFTPGQPVPLEFFVGRVPEIEKLRNLTRAAASGQLKVVFLTGERGIGKSSLVAYVRAAVERNDRALGLHTFLGGINCLEEAVRRIFDRLLNESLEYSWYEKIKQFFGDHIRQVGLLGTTVEFKPSPEDLSRILHNFASALRKLMQKLEEEKKVIFLALDDINGLASSPTFANWLKSLVDEIATSLKPLPLCLVLVGLEERRQSLIELQPSLSRVFDIIDVKVWCEDETKEFFRNAFARVNVPVEDRALSLLSRFAGGLPVIAHEIGDATFNADTDDRIDEKDALKGVFAAADIVGRKHLEPQVFQAIRSTRYRTILRKIAKKPFDVAFTASELRSLLAAEEIKVWHNFLSRMKELGVLEPDPERGRGAYRFKNHLHYLYFWLEAERAKKAKFD